MDFVIIIYLICNYVKINRFFVTIDIIFLFISPKIKEYLIDLKNKLFIKNSNNFEENEFRNKLTIISFVAIFAMLIMQVYIFQNLEMVLKLLKTISNKMKFDNEIMAILIEN